MWTTPAFSAALQIPCASSPVLPSGFSQRTCFPFRAASIVGSAWRSFGPPLSKSWTRSSCTCSRQSVVASSQPRSLRASSTFSGVRPEMETSRGTSAGSRNAASRKARECALPMKAYPSIATPIVSAIGGLRSDHAARCAAALRVRVHEHGCEEDEPRDDELRAGSQPEEVHPVLDRGDDERPEKSGHDTADTTEQARTAYHRRRDDEEQQVSSAGVD